MKPYFSIIVPVYNVEPYLRECLDSILAQTFTDWEAICIDDGSTDNSGMILDDYAKQDNRIHVCHIRNFGVSRARNLGLMEAKGVYVGFVDADDVICEEWLSTANNILRMGKPVDLLRMNFSWWVEGSALPHVNCYATNDVAVIEETSNVMPWGWNVLLEDGYCYVIFIRRTLVQGGEDEELFPVGLRLREDVVFLLRILPKVKRVAHCEYNGYFYRQRLSSASHGSIKECDRKLFRRYLKSLWRSARKTLKTSANFSHIVAHYRRHYWLSMGADTRYNPYRLWLAACRRYRRLTERLLHV